MRMIATGLRRMTTHALRGHVNCNCCYYIVIICDDIENRDNRFPFRYRIDIRGFFITLRPLNVTFYFAET